MNGSERIVAAALKFPSGMVVKGPMHALALMKAVDRGLLQDRGVNDLDDMEGYSIHDFGIQDGFVTSHGRFVSREDAKQIAAAANQLKSDPPPAGFRATGRAAWADPKLDSGDLTFDPADLRAAMAESESDGTDIVHDAIQRKRLSDRLAESKLKRILRGF